MYTPSAPTKIPKMVEIPPEESTIAFRAQPMLPSARVLTEEFLMSHDQTADPHRPKSFIYDSPASAQKENVLKKVSYTHMDLIDTIIANPTITHKELALRYGYHPNWISRMLASDALRAKFAERRAEIMDPGIMAETEERFRGLLNRSLDLLMEKIEATNNIDSLVKVIEVTSRAAGYGVSKNITNNDNRKFVVALPEKAPTSQSWAEKYGRDSVIEATAS